MSKRILTYGVELELADVDCTKSIPSEIGFWERGNLKNSNGCYVGYETCIMNSDFTVVDPDKIRCKKGGEIHVVPAYSIDVLVERIEKVFQIFPEAHMFLPGKMHIHIGIPDYNFRDLINLYKYVEENDLDFMDQICPESFMKKMQNDAGVSKDLFEHYLSSRRTVTNPKCFSKIDDFDSLDEVKYWWGTKCLYHYPRPVIAFDGKLSPSKQSVRVQSVHLQHLLKHNTVEFRNFAPTVDISLIRNCIEIADRFIREGLGGHTPVNNWIFNYEIPIWEYNSEIITKWWVGAKDGNSHIAHKPKKFHLLDVM